VQPFSSFTLLAAILMRLHVAGRYASASVAGAPMAATRQQEQGLDRQQQTEISRRQVDVVVNCERFSCGKLCDAGLAQKWFRVQFVKMWERSCTGVSAGALVL